MSSENIQKNITVDNVKEFTEESVIVRYYEDIRKAFHHVEKTEGIANDTGLFKPSLALPDLTEGLKALFAPARMDLIDLGTYKSIPINLLNLMGDPSTNTTKTYPSLFMVARAVEHIQKTGENIMIFVTTSGNKGTALRSAVAWAIELGLVTKTQLRVAMLVPEESSDKLRKSQLSEDPELRALNPLVLYRGEQGGDVKKVGSAFIEKYASYVYEKHNLRIWYSLDLKNYKIPDTARAFFEHEAREVKNKHNSTRKQIHAHAVSSAFGFIGYELGRTVLEQEGTSPKSAHPGYFLVQHLDTCDMVLHHLFESFSKDNIPQYKRDDSTGLLKQEAHPNFPQVSYEANEVLDTTFYSRTPFTSEYVSGLIKEFGGGGIAVSLYECIERYPLVREMLKPHNIHMPIDPRKVKEWSLVMAFTGIFNAIDRNLIDKNAEITIQASGFYSTDDFEQLPKESLALIEEGAPIDELLKYFAL